jgi:glycosyltransferase involved in cell wall biosynthesis
MTEQPLVSVVTPVHNGEPYLATCIESVLRQTYQNWELILVENRSTDASLATAHRYAALDSRIRIHQNDELLPVIANHNVAFRLLGKDSRYCKVLHADDFILPSCLAEMVQLAEAAPSVGIIGSYALHGIRVAGHGIPYPTTGATPLSPPYTILPGREIARLALLEDVYPFLSPSVLLIRSDLVRAREPYYDERILHADVAACYDLLQHVDFGFVHQILTYVRDHADSITSSFSRRLNGFILSNLDLLLRYGPVYLAPGDFERRQRRAMLTYYKFLARNLFRRTDHREFWAFHRRGLASIGLSLSRARLATAAILELLEIPLNLRKSLREVPGIPWLAQRALALWGGVRFPDRRSASSGEVRR